MEGRAASRSWRLMFGGAISTCLLLAWAMLAGGGTAAGSAAPAAVATDVPTPPTVTVTATVTATIFFPVTQTETPPAQTLTVIRTTTQTVNSTRTSVSSAPPRPGVTVVAPAVAPTPPTVTITPTARPTQAPSKGPQLSIVTQPGATFTTTRQGIAPRADSSPPISTLRFAAGTAGVAVTSAAGFGFLLLRRRGRYGL